MQQQNERMLVISVSLCTTRDGLALKLIADLNAIMIQQNQFITLLITTYTVVHKNCQLVFDNNTVKFFRCL